MIYQVVTKKRIIAGSIGDQICNKTKGKEGKKERIRRIENGIGLRLENKCTRRGLMHAQRVGYREVIRYKDDRYGTDT